MPPSFSETLAATVSASAGSMMDSRIAAWVSVKRKYRLATGSLTTRYDFP